MERRRRVLIMLAALAAGLGSAPASAELLPRPDEIALSSEKALLSEIVSLLIEPSTDAEEGMAALDKALARLGQPTRLRGFVQYMRAQALFHQERSAPAREAVEESIRLLPEYSAPLLLGTAIYVYNDQPGRAADYLMRASRIDPAVVAKMPEYEVDNLIHRLTAQHDQRRVRLVSERLLEIGWLSQSLSSRSKLAMRAIEARMAEGNVAGARILVPKLLVPSDSIELLIQSRYRELWPDIERWAGAELRDQWRVYLSETRAQWDASKDMASALSYARALDAAGHHDTLIRELLPLFSKPLDKIEDYDLLYVAGPVAGALARKGRWDEIETMYQRAGKVWVLGEHANALNLAANRARYLFFRGKTQEGLTLMDAVIADAQRWGGEINSDALAAMHRHRACMLHALGRGEEAALSRAHAIGREGPGSTAELYVCLDKPEAARDMLIAALDDPGKRAEVLNYMQKNDDLPMMSDYGRQSRARWEALRADPKLLAAIARHGRVLPYTHRAGAPAELPPAKPL
jgi:hypothetical protein